MNIKNLFILIAILAGLYFAGKYFNPIHSTEVFVNLADVQQDKMEPVAEAPKDPEFNKPTGEPAIGMLVPTASPTSLEPPKELPTRHLTISAGDKINFEVAVQDLPLYAAYARKGLLKRSEEAKPKFRFLSEMKGTEYLYFYCHTGTERGRDEFPISLVIVEIK